MMKKIVVTVNTIEQEIIDRMIKEKGYHGTSELFRTALRELERREYSGYKSVKKAANPTQPVTAEELEKYCIEVKHGSVEGEGMNRFCRYEESGLEITKPLLNLLK